jgi:N-acetylglucosamine-6-phosphate deacetylase
MAIKGFIDLHTHGIGRYDTRTSSPEDILKMARLHLEAGTVAFLPTIYSGPISQMRANMEAVREAMKRQDSGRRIRAKRPRNASWITEHGACILGVHLEGPFLNPLMAGAQDRDTFLKPTLSNLERLVDGYEDIIKIITIAPEMPGALRVIERCVERGIRVNMGHSDATYKQALDGKKAGATGITHIFNAMRPIHQRELGISGFGLIDEDIYIEVIPDCVHLDINILRLILKTKPRERVIFVSDSIKGAGERSAPIKRGDRILGGHLALSRMLKNLESQEMVNLNKAYRFVYQNPITYCQKPAHRRLLDYGIIN